MADDDENPQPEQALDERISSLETGQHNLTQKLDQILGIVAGKPAEDQGDGHEDKGTGTSMQREIREQLDARQKADADAADKHSIKSEVETIKATLAGMTERPPEQRVRRSTQFMWGKP